MEKRICKKCGKPVKRAGFLRVFNKIVFMYEDDIFDWTATYEHIGDKYGDKCGMAMMDISLTKKVDKTLRIRELEKQRLIRIQMYKDSFTTAIALCFLIAIAFAMIGLAGFTFLGGITSGIVISLFIFLISKQIEEDYKTRENRVNIKLKESD